MANSETNVDFFGYTDDSLSCSIKKAIELNDKLKLQTILNKRKKKSLPISVDNRGWSALHVAASLPDRKECLEMLLKHGKSVLLDINAESFECKTPLFIACELGHEDNVDVLLRKGCDLTKKRLDGTSPLHISATKGFTSITSLLLKQKISVNDQDWQGFTALHLAAMYGHLEVCRLLLNSEASFCLVDSDGNLPLHLASQNGYFEIVKLLEECDKTHVNYQNSHGITPLMLAVQNSNVQCVQYLLDNGTKTELRNKQDVIALQFAAAGGNKDILELILKNTDMKFVKHYCLYNFVNILDNKGTFYSLICCAINSGSVECLTVLLESELAKSILEAPYAENSGYCLDVFSPLAYLFSVRVDSVDETFDSFLRLLLKYDIVYMNDFVKILNIKWPESRVKFINPFSVIFNSEWPRVQKLKYFSLLNEHHITPDYCLFCYNDNTENFKDFNVLLGYLTFYKPALEAVCNGDIETVKLFLSNSLILEPDQLCYYLVVMKSSESSKEFNRNLKQIRSMYHFLIRLKPSYYNYKRFPRAAHFFNTFSRDEEFSRSNLQQLCRSVIRDQLRAKSLIDNLQHFKEKVEQLPLPKCLKSYLLFKN